jgi:3-oxoacyl-[acyl-carrier protein] reductase
MIDPGLKDKVVLVTGANHGIGAATAMAFAVQGAAVFLTYFGDPPPWARHPKGAGEVLRLIQEQGGRAQTWAADLADSANISRLFDRVEATLGPVDVLVNNAAHCRPDTFRPVGPEARAALGDRPLSAITPESHDHHFAVNSRAVALMMAQFARRHIQRGVRWGRIINVSTDGASGFSGEVSYGASKHALESYSRAAASELGKYGITVNIVAPGPVQTGWLAPELEKQEIASIPLGRVGQPEDVADIIVFLASEQARWVTGQLIYVGGGHVMPL